MPALLIAAAVTAGLLAAVAPRSTGASRRGAARVPVTAVIWLACVGLAAIATGVAIGSARIAAIDGGALDLASGSEATVRGYVAAFPRRSQGKVDVAVRTPGGLVMVEALEPVGELDVGSAIEATGTIHRPADWQRSYFERLGIAEVLAAGRLEQLDQRRGGLAGAVDAIRARAEAALARGTPESSSNLLRGFVLGEDDRIDDATRDDFKRSGLAHLLAVSGQNVVLLAILGVALFSLLGLSLRARLLAILALIAVYVPLTGAGASIQRAGVMGAAGVIAALAGRPSSRWYALLLAAAATLAMNPRATADIGWQLSFAAVLGILVFSAPLSRLLGGSRPRRLRRTLAEAAALTISATLATAPLMSFHFETLSLVALPANLLAVPAEAPVMWLGMIAGAAGQIDWLPAEPITWLAGLLAAYIAQIAAWTSAPRWAQVELGVGGLAALAAIYVLLGAWLALGLRWAGRRRELRATRPPAAGSGGTGPFGTGHRARVVAAALAVAVVAIGGAIASRDPPAASAGLRVTVLDVGQGDAILLEPSRGGPILVDAGLPGSGATESLSARGIDELAAIVVTHSDLDHAGGVPEVLAAVETSDLVFARLDQATLAAARAAGAELDRVAAGTVLRSGGLRLEVLWPAQEAIAAGPPAQPNQLCLVMLASWGGFRILLTGDAEAELAPVDPGDIDVLKLAHHGSDDAGLEGLLSRSDPELAVISVGEDNTYGHPTAATLAALAAAGVPVMRTDLDGDVEITATAAGWAVAGD